MGSSVKVGMVGAGFAASFHLRSYQQVKGIPVEVVAIASKTRIRAEQLAGRFGIAKVYDDYRVLLDDPSIAIVDLCVPNALHLPLVLETIKAGKHVICEKPLTGYFGQGEPDGEVGATSKRKMLDKVRADLAEVTRVMADRPVKFCYAENWIYAPSVRKTLEILDRCVVTGSVLEIRGEESHSGSHSEYSKWWRHTGGGALARLAAHPIGLGLFLKHREGRQKAGRPILPVEVSADGVDLTKTLAFQGVKSSPLVTGWGDVETWSQVTVTFSDGTRGVFYGADNLLGGMESTVDIRLSNARLKIEMLPVRVCQFYTVDPAPVQDVYFNEKQETKAGYSFPNPDEEWMLGYPHEIQDFMEAVALDRAPLSGLELAKQVVEVVYAGYVSMEERRKVVLSLTS
ncbi:MAG: Gfo/Idh/MocA family oxidoreductase [candidate division NC10 bacterium]|nr:Gfo/Idh/MocA family oxidoreductase [candidate division NC10 bacterium]